MAVTPNVQLPFPSLNDKPDVPRDIEALAARVDTLLFQLVDRVDQLSKDVHTTWPRINLFNASKTGANATRNADGNWRHPGSRLTLKTPRLDGTATGLKVLYLVRCKASVRTVGSGKEARFGQRIQRWNGTSTTKPASGISTAAQHDWVGQQQWQDFYNIFYMTGSDIDRVWEVEVRGDSAQPAGTQLEIGNIYLSVAAIAPAGIAGNNALPGYIDTTYNETTGEPEDLDAVTP